MSLDALKSFFSEDNTKPIAKHREDKKEEHSPILTAYIERENQTRELYFKMAENIKKSEQLRCKINKDFIKGVDPMEILKDCLECISLMTGDTVFYKQNIKYLK
jgi:hypothetical protein